MSTKPSIMAPVARKYSATGPQISPAPTAGSSDNDYQDLIFRANGLTQDESDFANRIEDPVTFFRNDPFWNKSINGRPTLRQSLITAGIIPANTPI